MMLLDRIFCRYGFHGHSEHVGEVEREYVSRYDLTADKTTIRAPMYKCSRCGTLWSRRA